MTEKKGRVMNIKDIEKMIKLVEDSGLSKLSVEEDGIKVELAKDQVVEAVSYQQQPVVQQTQEPVKVEQAVGPSQSSSEAASNDEVFTAPMVGTYYSSPSPEDPPFIKVGDSIKKGSPLCIIEAMKLFNEIEAEENITIVEILVNNQDPVEFGQPLFKIKRNA